MSLCQSAKLTSLTLFLISRSTAARVVTQAKCLARTGTHPPCSRHVCVCTRDTNSFRPRKQAAAQSQQVGARKEAFSPTPTPRDTTTTTTTQKDPNSNSTQDTGTTYILGHHLIMPRISHLSVAAACRTQGIAKLAQRHGQSVHGRWLSLPFVVWSGFRRSLCGSAGVNKSRVRDLPRSWSREQDGHRKQPAQRH